MCLIKISQMLQNHGKKMLFHLHLHNFKQLHLQHQQLLDHKKTQVEIESLLEHAVDNFGALHTSRIYKFLEEYGQKNCYFPR